VRDSWVTLMIGLHDGMRGNSRESLAVSAADQAMCN